MKSKKIGGFDEWEVKNAADTLRRAGEIVNDKKFLGVVRKEIAKQAKSSAKVLHWASGLS